MSLALTLNDGSALPSPLTFTRNRGADSTETYHLKLANTGGTSEPGIVLSIKELVGIVYQSQGTPVTDDREGRLEITSYDSSGTAGQDPGEGGWQVVGSFANAEFPTILAGNAIFFDFKLYQPSSSSSDGSVSLALFIPQPQRAFPVPDGVSAVANGVESFLNRKAHFAISGLAVTATGTPDDKANVATGSWMIDGIEYTDGSSRAVTCNQNDSASAALVTGESYFLAITRDTSITVPVTTKGLKGTAPVKPLLPANQVFCCWVQVHYHATASVINTSDITGLVAYGRYYATDSALTTTVFPGNSITDGFRQWNYDTTAVTLVDNATNEIWMGRDGVLVVTQTGATQPSPGALRLWTKTTVSGAVTGTTDRRVFIPGPAPGYSPSDFNVGGPIELSGLSESQITGLVTDLGLKAPLASPTFTGTPLGPTPTANDNSTKLATTAYADATRGQGKKAAVTLANGDNDNVDCSGGDYIRITGPSTSFTIRGIVAGADGDRKDIYNPTGQTLVFKHENAGSTAANRLHSATGADVTANSAKVRYDVTDSRWIIL